MPGAAVVGYSHALPVTIVFAEPFALAFPVAFDQSADQSVRDPYRGAHFACESGRHG